jgi:hypothetical protein
MKRSMTEGGTPQSPQHRCILVDDSPRRTLSNQPTGPAHDQGVSPKSVLVIAGVWVGDAFSRTQRGGVGSYRRTQRAAASRGVCPPTPDDAGKGEYPLPSTFTLRHTGGLAASPGSCRIIAGRSQNLRKWEARNTCVVDDDRVARDATKDCEGSGR